MGTHFWCTKFASSWWRVERNVRPCARAEMSRQSSICGVRRGALLYSAGASETYGLNRARTVALQNETWTQLLQYEVGVGSQWFQIATHTSKRFWWRLEFYSTGLWLESGAYRCVAERNLNTIAVIWSGTWIPTISICDAHVKTVLMPLEVL